MSPLERSPKDLWFAAAAGAALVAVIGLSALLVAPGMATARGWLGEHQRWHSDDGDSESRHVERAVNRFARWIDASEEQEARIRDVATRTLSELSESQGDYADLRGALIDELRKPEIDRGALERVRREQLDRLETLSSSLVDAIAEIGSVLTPEQRDELAEIAESFGPRDDDARRWRRWRH